MQTPFFYFSWDKAVKSFNATAKYIKGGVLYLLNFWRKDDCIKLKAICKATLLSIGSSLEGKIMVQNHPWTQMSFNSVPIKLDLMEWNLLITKLAKIFFWWNWSYLQCDIAEVKKKLEYTLVILLLIVVFFFPAMSYYSFVFGIFGHSIPVMYLTSNLTFSWWNDSSQWWHTVKKTPFLMIGFLTLEN